MKYPWDTERTVWRTFLEYLERDDDEEFRYVFRKSDTVKQQYDFFRAGFMAGGNS